MAEKLVQHRHCQTCLKAIPLGEEFCNDECRDKWNQMIKANRKKNLIVWAWLMAAVVILILIMFI